MDLTPSIKTYIETKLNPLGKFIKRFEARGEITTFIEVGRTTKHHKHGDVFRAAIRIDLPQKRFFAEDLDANLRTAVDKIKNRIKDDLQKYKEKSVRHH